LRLQLIDRVATLIANYFDVAMGLMFFCERLIFDF
jgi:hypothetical protein